MQVSSLFAMVQKAGEGGCMNKIGKLVKSFDFSSYLQSACQVK